MRRAAVLLAFVALASCSHTTVRRTTGSAVPASGSSSPSVTTTASSAPGTTGPQPNASTIVTPDPTAAAVSQSGIAGQVLAGPTCPVERAGHPCPPREVDDATVTAKGPQTRSTRTDAHGKFVLKLDPGTYDVTADSKTVFGCDSKHVQVVAHRYTQVTISCDTGMR